MHVLTVSCAVCVCVCVCCPHRIQWKIYSSTSRNLSNAGAFFHCDCGNSSELLWFHAKWYTFYSLKPIIRLRFIDLLFIALQRKSHTNTHRKKERGNGMRICNMHACDSTLYYIIIFPRCACAANKFNAIKSEKGEYKTRFETQPGSFVHENSSNRPKRI